jgi:FAD/FMN-containing dehydrogenase
VATTAPAPPAGVERLRGRLRGELLTPSDPAYDQARRLWNAAIDRRPALIVRCAAAADVLAGVEFARTAGLPLAVRGGGHSVAGTGSCDGGLVLDCSPMKAVRVDPAERTAWAEPGLLWGELDHETQAFGLATTGGIVTHTGIAGLTLGGGIGWLMRRAGATCDNLLAAEVATADGRLVRASEREHPELLWGLRGGGGNFGVVTGFSYRLHPVGPAVLAGPLLFAADDAAELLRFYRDFVREAPDAFSSVLNLRFAPPLPFIPERLHGAPVVTVVVFWAGPLEEGERFLEPLRRHGRPLLDLVTVKPYAEHQRTFDATVPHGLRYYWKSEYLEDLSDAAVEALAANAWLSRSPRSYTIVFQLGGALARPGPDAGAFSGRRAGYAVNINAAATPDDDADHDAQAAWARASWAALRPLSAGVYANFLAVDDADRVRAAYGPAWDRLVACKRAWDPDNLFRVNQNIPPA